MTKFGRNDKNPEGMTVLRKNDNNAEGMTKYFFEKKNFLAQMSLQLALLPQLGHKKAIGTLGYPIDSKLKD